MAGVFLCNHLMDGETSGNPHSQISSQENINIGFNMLVILPSVVSASQARFTQCNLFFAVGAARADTNDTSLCRSAAK